MPGIKADFISPLEPRHVCGLCRLVIRSPMQTNCGHIFCADCLKEVMSSGEKALCPIDGETISQMFPDNACRREIQKLEVRCRYTKCNGCPWTGTLSTEDVHYITCEYRDEQCPDCGNFMMWDKFKKHAEVECPMRLTVCRYCSESVPASHEKLHIQKECSGVELPCPNNCNPNRVMKRQELNKHLSAEDGDCPFSKVDCPYKPLGCSFTGPRSLLAKHLQDNVVHHQHLLVKVVTANAQRASDLAKVVDILEAQISTLEIRVNNLEKDQESNALCIEDLEKRTSEFQSQYMGRISSLEKLFASKVSADDDQLLRRIPELVMKSEEMSRAVEKLMSNGADQELRIELLEQAMHNGILKYVFEIFNHECIKLLVCTSPLIYGHPRPFSRWTLQGLISDNNEKD